MPKISIFLDFDNTLMATEQYAIPSLIERFNLLYSQQIGRKLDYKEFKQHFHGQARETLCHHLSEYFKVNIDYHILYESREWRIMQYLQSLPNGIEMAPNLLPTLKLLIAQNFELSLVTNNPIQRAFAAMRYAQNGKGNELAKCFGTRFFEAGDIQKPKPDVYLRALAQTNANVKYSFAVEDSLTGATAAIDAGIKTIAFTGFADDPVTLKEKMITKGCIDSFHDWSNFPGLLKMYLPQLETAMQSNLS